MKRAVIILSILLLISITTNIRQHRIIKNESLWCQMYWEEVEKSLSLEFEIESLKELPH